ncbi:hypothetical protein BDZ89DRAFT_1056723 [Hymenopellis radicata]|nr:hypothetical protein BDZ89DRAFT_1056723 [Hymenopellis radicata]
MCKFFLEGKCRYGDKCIKSHQTKRNAASSRSSHATHTSSRRQSPTTHASDHSAASRTGKTAAQSSSRRSSARGTPLSPLTPQHTSGRQSPVLSEQETPAPSLPAALSIAPFIQSSHTARAICNGFAMQRGCSMPGTCQLIHNLSELLYTILANNAEPHQSSCTQANCSLRHAVSPREYQVLLSTSVQSQSEKFAPAYPSLLPGAPQECIFFFSGSCDKGPMCKFSHVPSIQQPAVQPLKLKPCTFFAEGKCRRGESCTYSHDLAETTSGNSWGNGSHSRDRGRSARPVTTTQSNGWGETQGDTPAGGWGDEGWGSPYVPSNSADPGQSSSSPPEPEVQEENGWGTVEDDNNWNSQAEPEAPQGSADDDTGWGTAEVSTSAWDNDPSWNDDSSPAKTTTICSFHQQGFCKLGDDCQFLHEQSSNEPEPQAPTQTYDTERRIWANIFNCNVRFGPGAIPEHIITSHDSNVVVISNLSVAARDALDGLVTPYGLPLEPLQLTFDQANQMSVKIIMENSDVATEVVAGLNGTECDSQKLVAELEDDDNLSAEIPGISRTLRLSWPAPVIAIRLYYDNITKAKEKTAQFDKSVICGRAITATFQRPATNQAYGFAVVLSNVPPAADVDAILEQADCTTKSVTSPTYTLSETRDQLLAELVAFGTMRLDMVPHESSKAKVTAFATFSTTSAASTAAQALHLREYGFLGPPPNGRLNVQHQYYVSYTVCHGALKAVAEDVEVLAMPDCIMRVHDEEDPDGTEATDKDKIIRMASKEKMSFMRFKLSLDTLLRGELFVVDGKFVWHEYFHLTSSLGALAKLNADHKVFIERDFLNGALRIHGTKDRREAAKCAILKMLKVVEQQQKEVVLQRHLLRALLGGGLEDLYSAFDAKKLELDLVARKLVVRLPEKDILLVEEQLSSMLPETAEGNPEEACCGLCDLPVMENAFVLPCGHTYDRSCLDSLLKSYIRLGFSGLRCRARVVDEEGGERDCEELISNDIYLLFLNEDERDKLLEASFVSYLRTDPDFGAGFYYCPKPHCPMVYRGSRRPAKGRGILCRVCGNSQICTYCHIDFHDGFTCAEYQAFLNDATKEEVDSDGSTTAVEEVDSSTA